MSKGAKISWNLKQDALPFFFSKYTQSNQTPKHLMVMERALSCECKLVCKSHFHIINPQIDLSALVHFFMENMLNQLWDHRQAFERGHSLPNLVH